MCMCVWGGGGVPFDTALPMHLHRSWQGRKGPQSLRPGAAEGQSGGLYCLPLRFTRSSPCARAKGALCHRSAAERCEGRDRGLGSQLALRADKSVSTQSALLSRLTRSSHALSSIPAKEHLIDTTSANTVLEQTAGVCPLLVRVPARWPVRAAMMGKTFPHRHGRHPRPLDLPLSWAHVQARGSQPGLVGARQVREDADSRHAQEVPVRGSSQVRVSEYGTKCTPHTHYVRTRASRSSVRVAF